jgi:hypothetical protein
MLNLESKNTHYIFDEHGMLVVKGDNESWKDSIGRTVLAWIAYGRPKELQNAILSCFREGKLYRHPNHTELASRDHISYYCTHRKLLNKFIPPFKFQRGMNLWMKSLTGNRTAEFFYYLWYIPGAYLGNWWLKRCRKWGNIRQELHHMDWMHNTYTNGEYIQRNHTLWQKLWSKIINTTIPAYALHNKAWQIYVMPTSKRKEKLKRILLKRAGKSNLMLRLLFGDKVTQEEIDNYPHMTGYRPGAYLNTTTRTIREMDAVESEYNTYEKQLIKWLYDK